MNPIQVQRAPDQDTTGHRNGTERYRLDIEGLRAIAVAVVVAFHFKVPGAQGGFVGVDIFFVISGYLITGLLANERAATGSLDLLRFYGRRARRLLPAALVSTVVTLAVGTFVLSPPELVAASKAAFASSIFVSNFWFLRASLDYFAPESALNPFLHTWSLSVEEQFYVFWPALVLVAASSAARPHRLAKAIGATFVVSLAACIVLTTTRQPWAFYLAPTRAWEFAVGGLAALPVIEQAIKKHVPSGIIGALGFVAIATSILFIPIDAPFPGWIALWPVVGTAVLLVAGRSSASNGLVRLLTWPPMTWIGQRSYAIYLWHWPAIVFANVLSPASPVIAGMGALAVTLVGAGISFRLVEKPVRRHRWLVSGARRSAWFAAAMTTAAVLLTLGSVATFAHFAHSAPQVAISNAINTYPAASGSGGNCLVPFTAADVTVCTFGTSDHPARTIVLLGDSHADHWSSPLIQIATKRGWRLLTVMKGFCPAASLGVYVARLQRVSDECQAWRNSAIERIVSLHPDLVIIGEASSSYVHLGMTSRDPRIASGTAWMDALTSTLERLSSAGLAVLLMGDTPQRHESASVCLARMAWHSGDETRCATTIAEGVDASVAEIERKAVSHFPRASYLDWTARFCPGPDERCLAIIDGIVVYRDTNHISNAFALHLAPELERAIDHSFAQRTRAVSD